MIYDFCIISCKTIKMSCFFMDKPCHDANIYRNMNIKKYFSIKTNIEFYFL